MDDWDLKRDTRRNLARDGHPLPELPGPESVVEVLRAAQEQTRPGVLHARADGWPTLHELVQGNHAAWRVVLERAKEMAAEAKDPPSLAGWAAIIGQATAAVRAEYGVPDGVVTPTSEGLDAPRTSQAQQAQGQGAAALEQALAGASDADVVAAYRALRGDAAPEAGQ